MKKYFVGLLVLLAFVAVAKSDKSCAFSGSEMMIPDAYDCEEVKERAEGFRFFPRFPWHRFPPLFSTLFPNFPWWPTTPDPDDDAEQCPDEGIKSIPHPKSCEKFILCVNGQELEMRCAPGLHFSREIRNCVPEDIADCEIERVWECPDEDDMDNLVFLPNKENCQKYYLCLGGEAHPLSCAKGLHWSINEEACMEEDEAECEFEDGEGIEECPDEGIKLISHPYNCEMYVLCVGGERIKRDCAPGFHFSREFRSCVSPEMSDCEEGVEQCPPNGIHLIAHPDNCNKYVLCINGDRFKRDCAPGLHFSRELRACTTPDEAECEDGDIEHCPDEGIKLISHPDDCEKYVLCINGDRHKRNCAPGLHFSRDLRACTTPEEAECGDDIEHCPDDGIKLISHPDNCEKYVLCINGDRHKRECAPGLHFSREIRACTTPEEAECDDDDMEHCPDDGIKMISHPDNCEKFILCINGERHKRECAPGLHFSRELRTCATPDVAECEDDEDMEHCPDEGIKSISHPDNCEKFVLCVNGDRFKMDCAPGMHFSRDLRTCTTPDEAECDTDGYEQCPEDGVKSISHPDDCNKYILCVAGTRIKRNCAPGLHFSRELRACTTPADAECEGDIEHCPDEGIKSISHPTECGKYILCVGGTRIKRNCAPGLHFSRDLRACTTPDVAECEDGYSCPEEDDMDNLVFIPNTENCNKFYFCFGGEGVSMSCASGLHWSQEHQTCMPEALANCEYGDGFAQCPDEGITSIPHPTLCSMFVLCVGGTRMKMDCAPGFHFSSEFGSCVHPAVANCDLEDGEEYVEKPCPAQDDLTNLVFLPSKENCSEYSICYQGEPTHFSCANGLHWNQKHNVCMLKDEAGCKI